MLGVYFVIFSLLLVVAGPVLLLTKKRARFGLSEKLGRVPARVLAKGQRPRIWFHTVSVGEFNATVGLIDAFRASHPEFEIFISTTTGAGQQLAKEKSGSFATIFYFPFDLPWAFNPWLDRVQPDVVSFSETEIWPGFTAECHRRGIAICRVNARISPRSFESYKRVSFFLKNTIEKFTAIGAQSDQEAFRYRSLGADQSTITVTGNMKLDGLKPLSHQEQLQLKQSLNLGQSDIVVIGGSTHEGEESALLESLTNLLNQPDAVRPPVRLILAPRHPDRFQRVFAVVESYGFRARSYSRGEKFERENDVYVLDTIGLLSRFYSLATIAFVGGTLAPIGGHNLVEPCLYQVPVVCGPHVYKTRDTAQALLERQALIKVADKKELHAALKELIGSSSKRRMLGLSGKDFLDSSQGAIGRTLQVVNSVLEARTLKTAHPTAPKGGLA